MNDMKDAERRGLLTLKPHVKKYGAKIERVDPKTCYVYKGTGANQIVVEIKYRWSEKKIEKTLHKHFFEDVREKERKKRITAEPKNSKKAKVKKLIAAGQKAHKTAKKAHTFVKKHAGDTYRDPLTGQIVKRSSAKTQTPAKKKTSTSKGQTPAKKKAPARKKPPVKSLPVFKAPEIKIPQIKFKF